MTRTIHPLILNTILGLGLLSACDKHSQGSEGGSILRDAGPNSEEDDCAETEPNRLEDGGAVDAAVGGAAGGPSQTGGTGTTSNTGGSTGQPQSGGSGGSGGTREPTTADAGPGPVLTDEDAGSSEPDKLCASCGGCEEVIEVVSTMHTEGTVTYADPPPTSGPHNPCWGRWGVHDEPLRPERWVHNLEHGGVVFLYNCPDGCAADVATLTQIASTRYRTVVTAYPDLPTRFGIVSWGHRLTSNCLDKDAFVEFFNKNFDHAPESNSNPPNPNCPP